MAQNSFKDLLKNAGFHSFLWTQFLGAFNDNVYKILVSMRAVHVAANTGNGSQYLSLAGVVFVVPFLLFSGYSGHLADVVSKRKVLISVKVFEIFVMTLGLAAFFSTRIELMLLVLFLMALHSTIFSPAKYGIVPEMLPDKDLSRANGLLEMSTFVAIVLGTSIGSFLFAVWKNEPWKMGVVTLAVAVAGFLTSLKITRVPPSGAHAPFQKNPFGEIWIGTKHLLKDRPLTLTVLGISYFWFLGALFQMDLFLFGSGGIEAERFKCWIAGDLARHRDWGGQHAGRAAFRKQGGTGIGPAGCGLHGHFLHPSFCVTRVLCVLGNFAFACWAWPAAFLSCR